MTNKYEGEQSIPVKAAEVHCATCSCSPGMTPAVRYDATPAEHEGVVREHLIRMGWTPPHSAPVGVEGFDAWWKSHSIDSEFPETMDDRTFAKAAWDAALAQQPAAVDGDRRDAERYRFIAADRSAAWEEELDAAIDQARGATIQEK